MCTPLLLSASAGFALALLSAPSAARAASSEMLSGVVIEGGIVCPMLKLESGETVSLTGVTSQHAPVGNTLNARGNFIRYSNCQQAARTFRVEEILNSHPELQ